MDVTPPFFPPTRFSHRLFPGPTGKLNMLGCRGSVPCMCELQDMTVLSAFPPLCLSALPCEGVIDFGGAFLLETLSSSFS